MIRVTEHLLALATVLAAALIVYVGYAQVGWVYAVANAAVLIGLWFFLTTSKRI